MSDQRAFSHDGNLLFQLLARIGRRRRIQSLAMIGLTLVVGVLEMLSIGAVIPFLGILVAPENLWAHAQVRRWALEFGMGSPNEMVLPLTLAFLALTIFSGVGRLALTYVSNRLVYAIGSDINSEIFRRSLYQPYKAHVDRNSSTLVSGILLKSASIISVIHAMVSMSASIVILGGIITMLLIADLATTLVGVIVFGGIYGAVVILTRVRLGGNSKRMARNHDCTVRILQEGFGGIRDVLLDGSQAVYCDHFRRADHQLRKAKAENIFIATSPRVVLESVGVVLIASFAWWMSAKTGGLSVSIPMLGALAMGALRMLPQMQQAYAAWAQYVSNRALLWDVLVLLDQPYDEATADNSCPPMPFRKEIRLRKVRFRYGSSGPWILDGVDLSIAKGTTVGFVGTTGSGKSTLIDLVMGLLDPTEGVLEVDGISVSADLKRSWQKRIAHVPQAIFLKDASIADNIAFNTGTGVIDMNRVNRCAGWAQLAPFIENLPHGYATHVGERGIRLSGGQRQRIGIARALYKGVDVLVLDEATSALDAETEAAVMESIGKLNEELTVFIIAHRLTTLRGCDRIYTIEAGRAVAVESLDRLLLPEGNK